MNRIIFFIDGFNLYHSIDDKKEYHKFKWLNLKKLCNCFINKSSEIVGIKYFTTYAKWKPESFNKHKIYVRALEYIEGIYIIYGEFRKKDKKCPKCHRVYTSHEEKRTDVNIAINLFEDGMHDKYDTAIIISGDSDLIPAIKAARMNYPSKKFGIIIPIGRRAEELKYIADFHMKIKEKHMISSQLPDEIKISDTSIIKKPDSWV